MPALTAILTIALILVPMSASQAYASDIEIIEPSSKTWIFTQSCKAVPILQESLSPFPISNSEVVCFPKASINRIEQNVQLLRSVFPSDIFIFTYDTNNPQTARDLHLFLLQSDSNAPKGAAGKAFIKQGYAVAASSGLIVQHEYLHVSTCSVAHNQFGEPDISRPIAIKPWC